MIKLSFWEQQLPFSFVLKENLSGSVYKNITILFMPDNSLEVSLVWRQKLKASWSFSAFCIHREPQHYIFFPSKNLEEKTSSKAATTKHLECFRRVRIILSREGNIWIGNRLLCQPKCCKFLLFFWALSHDESVGKWQRLLYLNWYRKF